MNIDTDKLSTGLIMRLCMVGPFVVIVYYLYAFGFMLHRNLGGVLRVFVWVYGLTFGVLNFAFNVTCGSFIYLELPREWFFSDRTQRYLNGSDVEKREAAELFGVLLNRQDYDHVKFGKDNV